MLILVSKNVFEGRDWGWYIGMGNIKQNGVWRNDRCIGTSETGRSKLIYKADRLCKSYKSKIKLLRSTQLPYRQKNCYCGMINNSTDF